MKRRLNLLFLAYLLAGSTVLAASGYGLRTFQVKRSSGSLLQKARRERQDGDLKEAEKSYQRYLQLVPNDGDALADYGLTLDALDKTGAQRYKVATTLEKAVRLNPARDDARRRLVEVDQDLRQFADAKYHAEELLKKSPKNAELETLLGRCLEGNGEFAEAEKQYEQAHQDEPARIETAVALANLLRKEQRSDPKRSEAVMAEMIDKNPSSHEARVALARYYRTGGSGVDRDKDEIPAAALPAEAAACVAWTEIGPAWLAVARERYDSGPTLLCKAELEMVKARQLKADDAEVLLESVEIARARKWLQGAKVYARRGLELYPQDARMYEQVAELAVHVGNTDEAIAVLENGVNSLPDQRELLFLLADLLAAKGDAESLKKSAGYAAELKKKNIDQAVLTFLDGHRKFSEGNWLEASKSFEIAYPGLVRLPDLQRQATLLLGHCYEQLDDPDREYIAYLRGVPEDVNSPQWLLATDGVARALVGMNKLTEALEAYRKLFAQVPGARVLWARVKISQNLSRPKAGQDWAIVDQMLGEAQQLFPKSLEVTVLRAQSLAGQDRLKEAKKLLEEAPKSEVEAENIGLWIARASLASVEGTDAALAVLDQAVKEVGDRADFRLARLSFLLSLDSKEALKKLAPVEEGLDKFSAADQQRLWRGLAEAYVVVGEVDKATRIWEMIAEQRPNDLGVRLRLFDLALMAKDDAAMKNQLQHIRRLEGEKGLLWRYGTAAQLINQAQRAEKKELQEAEKKGLKEAGALLAGVAADRPTWYRVPSRQAQLALLEGRRDDAIRYYLNAIELGERNPGMLLEAMRVLRERGRHEDAYQVIKKLPEQAPVMKQFGELAVDLSLRAKDFRGGLRFAEKAQADNPNDYRAHLLLGQAYWANGQLLKAKASLRDAVEKAEKKPETWVALITFLARTDQRKDAFDELARAQKVLPMDENRLAYASCYLALGQAKEAKELYQAALQASPRDLPTLRAAAGFFLGIGDLPEARRHLETIIRLQHSPEDVAAAKRTLALVLTVDGSSFEDKRKILTEMGFLGPQDKESDTPDDRRTRAILRFTQKRRQDRVEAIRILESISQLQPLTANDQFVLAQMYGSLGNNNQVRSLMQSVLSKDNDNPLYLAFFARYLLGQKDPVEAKRWVDRLADLQPKAGQTYELKARLLHAQEKTAEAVALLVAYADEKDASLLGIAYLLEQLEKAPKDTAKRMYERFVDKVDKDRKPDALLALAGFLGRNGHLKEALEMYGQQLRGDHNPERIIGTALFVLYQIKSGPEEWKRVEDWIQEALPKAKDDQRAALHMHLATLYNLEGRFEESEKTYRRCLNDNPRDTLSMNNLAWLLATKGQKADEALTHIQRAIDLNGPRPGLLDTRAIVYLAQDKSDLALKDLKDIVADNPSGTSYFHLAQAYHAAKDKPAAREALQQALKTYNLKEQELHPFEREKYQQLQADLGAKDESKP